MAHAGVPPVDASAVAPLNVEVRSIDYVPRSERHGKAWHLGAVWFVGNAELVSFATGPIGISLGLNFAWTAVAIVLGTLLGTLFMAFHSAQGPKLGLSQMIQSRAQFGYYGALLPIVAVLFVTIGYGVFDTVLGGEVFNATIRTTTKGSYVLFAVLALLLTVFGYQMIHRFSRWASLLYIVNFGLFTAIALANTHLASDQFSLSGASFQWGPFLIVLGALMSYNLTWAPYVSDYSRYLPADTPDQLDLHLDLLGRGHRHDLAGNHRGVRRRRPPRPLAGPGARDHPPRQPDPAAGLLRSPRRHQHGRRLPRGGDLARGAAGHLV
jgi:purine-cytosine permease-like protein